GAALPVTGGGMGPVTIPVALAGGLKFMQSHFGLNGGIEGQTGQQKDGARRLFEGEGTMSEEEKGAVDQLLEEEDIANGVDPKQLTEGMRSVRRLTRAYNKLLERGKPEEAN